MAVIIVIIVIVVVEIFFYVIMISFAEIKRFDRSNLLSEHGRIKTRCGKLNIFNFHEHSFMRPCSLTLSYL